ncbi:hypothetical protein [Flavobacterium terrigena]|uniref:Uncharacterized protein n=1 Tax=Flavobacterium terrigena TaxID=402734 RepID=A0A1H6SF05_9FLAO|nr:hypothetical protein [Flavobacterium terrigena]SEI62600.1 hypothetical protein SAMN05660918_1195 [Flavobacterium terrigena]
MIDINFFTFKDLDKKKKSILERFPDLIKCDHDNFYSLSEYIYDSPSKFYNRDIHQVMDSFLEDIFTSKKDITDFFKILNESSYEFNHAIKTLNTINKKDIHTELLPNNDAELMYFFSDKIIYEYLKLNDVVLLGILKPIAFYLRVKNNKGTEKLDIYNCIETLKTVKDFNNLTKNYNNTLRNSIAHGGVTFESSRIKFKDKKETQEYYSWDFINKFDDLVDISNAIVLAYKKILFQYLDVLNGYNISIPSSIMEIELRFKTSHYGWEIIHSYDNTISKGNQYNILIKTTLNSRKFMNFSAAYTAITLEKLLPKKYNNVFFQIKTKYKMPCWQSVDLEKLREFYKGEKVNITEGTMFFDEKILGEKRDYLRINKSFIFGNLKNENKTINLRYIKHHSKSNYNVIEKAGIYLDYESTNKEKIEEFIRNNTKKIISYVKKEKRKKHSSNLKQIILSDKYLQIYIYNKDYRKRTFYNKQKDENFIGMLHVNLTNKISNIVPMFGTKENNKNCLIIWNKKSDIYE